MDRPIFTRHDPIYSSSLISSGNRKKDTLRMNQPTRKIKRILIYCYYYFLALIKPNSQRCGALGEKTLFCWRRGGDSPFIKMSIASAHTHRDRGGGAGEGGVVWLIWTEEVETFYAQQWCSLCIQTEQWPREAPLENHRNPTTFLQWVLQRSNI